MACLTGSTLMSAQEGHPLKGSWLGTWGPAKTHSNDIVLVMNWDGKTITGMINPGTDNIPIKNATLNPEGWVVHFEADAKDKAGVAQLRHRRQDRKPGVPQPLDHRHVEEPARERARSRSAGSSDERPSMNVWRCTRLRARRRAAARNRRFAHHPISAKFDDKKPQTLSGIVTLVDWSNPHVHVFMNVKDDNDADNWAVETREPDRSAAERLDSRLAAAGRRDHGRGHLGAERQPAGLGQHDHADGHRQAGAARHAARRRRLCSRSGRRRAGPTSSRGSDRRRAASQGYWAFPSSTVLVENGANVAMDQWGLLTNIADASEVAPMQPWALALYRTGSAGFCRTTRPI